jgi:hypothetical protein
MAKRNDSVILAGLVGLLLATAPAVGTQARVSTTHGPAAAAPARFDGKWSVLIVTDAGTCDRAYRYMLRIANGVVSYDDPSIAVSGRVDPRGHVSVSVSAGGQRASGTGELSGDSGEGSWSGRSAASQCSGHWEAERRG